MLLAQIDLEKYTEDIHVTFDPNVNVMGSQGQKLDFHENCFNSSTLYGIVMKFGDMKRLDIVHKSYRMKKLSGVTWGHGGKHLQLDCTPPYARRIHITYKQSILLYHIATTITILRFH